MISVQKSLESKSCGKLHTRDRGHHVPIPKSPYTLFQVPACLELRIRYRFNHDLGQGMADESAKVLWKAGKSVVVSLQSS